MSNLALSPSRIELQRHRSPVDGDWDVVSERRPCPICGGGTECSRHVDDPFVSCSQKPSEWPLTNGGWLHRVGAVDMGAALAGVTAGSAPT